MNQLSNPLLPLPDISNGTLLLPQSAALKLGPGPNEERGMRLEYQWVLISLVGIGMALAILAYL